jgi:hypothetical protein
MACTPHPQELRNRLAQNLLTPARDEDGSAFSHHGLCAGEADAGAAAIDQRSLTDQASGHIVFLPVRSAPDLRTADRRAPHRLSAMGVGIE